ncbi:MAG: (2Fe-2S) ferredoxin domain-containing protein [Peptococcaceae bacterium]|jgi:NADP-reducing hydrogenase subunit HndB|nr:(2Fe-2S) ferredoxin domain-containing protein [Peptococcaceae bacterium]MDH7525948.1 (2Fe-2S) ferredoxin domain-containing protein [Peptococcaceae bacterium]
MTPVKDKMIEFRQNSIKIYRKLEEEKKNKTRIIVHLGICGTSVGAKEVEKRLIKLTEKHDMVGKVIIEPAGCLGLCSMEPIIQIFKPGMRSSVYALVTEEMAEVIFTQHVINGVAVVPWLLSTRMERR